MASGATGRVLEAPMAVRLAPCCWPHSGFLSLSPEREERQTPPCGETPWGWSGPSPVPCSQLGRTFWGTGGGGICPEGFGDRTATSGVLWSFFWTTDCFGAFQGERLALCQAPEGMLLDPMDAAVCGGGLVRRARRPWATPAGHHSYPSEVSGSTVRLLSGCFGWVVGMCTHHPTSA